MKKAISDGTEHGAHVLFNKLVRCEREGSVFFVGAQSNNYRRTGAMTLEYTRELVAKLTALLIEHDRELGTTGPAFNDIRLTAACEAIRFELIRDGYPIMAGSVTIDLAKKAKAFLDGQFSPPDKKVVPIRQKG